MQSRTSETLGIDVRFCGQGNADHAREGKPMKDSASLKYADNYKLESLPSFDAQDTAVREAPSNTNEAGKCLAYFALRVRHEMSITDTLADHIAKAFEAAAKAPSSKRAKVLTEALYLTAPR